MAETESLHETGGVPRHGVLDAVTRLLMVAAAMGAGALAYHDHFRDDFPWTRSVGWLAVGWVLLGLGLRGDKPPTEARRRRGLRWAAGLVAIGGGVVAATTMLQPGRELQAGVATIVALAALIVARWLPFRDDDVRNLIGPDAVAAPTGLRRWVLTVVSVVLGIVAAAINGRLHLPGVLLWFASLVAFAAAMWEAAPATGVATAWVEDGGPQLSRRTVWVALLLIIALGFALRVTLLDNVPALVDADEGRLGNYAASIVADGFPNFFDIGWNAFPHLSFLLDYIWVPVLGMDNTSVRMSSVTLGTLSLLVMFFWVRRWWGNVIGLLAVLLMAINQEHIYWSRIGLTNIQQVLAATLMLVTFARVLATWRAIDWVWLGYAIGFTFHVYHAAKLFPALLAVAALVFALGIRGFLGRCLRGLPVAALAFVLCLGPLLVTIYERWALFYTNNANRFDLYELQAAYRAGDVTAVRGYLWGHVVNSLLVFVSVPYKLAIFEAVLCVPFVLGLGWMLWRWRDPRHLVTVWWILGTLVIGGMMTSWAPNKPRLMGFLPLLCVVPAVLAGRVRATLHRLLPAYADHIAVPLLVLWLAAALYGNWYTEFIYLPSLQRADPMTSSCRVIKRVPLPATLYAVGVGAEIQPKIAAHDCMIPPHPDRTLINLADDAAVVPLPPTQRGTAVVFLPKGQKEMVPLVEHYYPDARHDVTVSADGTVLLHVFTLQPEDIERRRGFEVTYRTAMRTWTLPQGSDVIRAPEQQDGPVQASGRGVVWIASPGTYAFRSARGTLAVDGQPVNADHPLTLAAGWHGIAVDATLQPGADAIGVQWRPPDAPDWTPIPKAFLHAHPEAHGLLGRYFARPIAADSAAAIADPSDFVQIEPVLDFDWLQEADDPPPSAAFAARPSTMEWVGTVDLPEGGNHGLRLESSTPAQLFINGALVLSAAGGRANPPSETTLTGMSGTVPILVRTARAADDNPSWWRLRLLWRTPGGEWTAFVPYHPPALDAPGVRK